MEAYQHLASSFAVSTVLVAAMTGLNTGIEIFLVLLGTGVGTLIDLDHFLIARIKNGDWSHLKAALGNPHETLYDSSFLFTSGDVSKSDRMLSHHIIGTVIVGGTYLYTVKDGVISSLILSKASVLLLGTVIYVHIMLDLVWDVMDSW